MKVKEVIKQLENLPPDKKVFFYDELSKLEFSIDKISFKAKEGKIHLEEIYYRR